MRGRRTAMSCGPKRAACAQPADLQLTAGRAATGSRCRSLSAAAGAERAYRLVFDEVPAGPQASGAGFASALAMDIPLYVEPLVFSSAQVGCTSNRAQMALALIATNSVASSLRLRDVACIKARSHPRDSPNRRSREVHACDRPARDGEKRASTPFDRTGRCRSARLDRHLRGARAVARWPQRSPPRSPAPHPGLPPPKSSLLNSRRPRPHARSRFSTASSTASHKGPCSHCRAIRNARHRSSHCVVGDHDSR